MNSKLEFKVSDEVSNLGVVVSGIVIENLKNVKLLQSLKYIPLPLRFPRQPSKIIIH